MISWILGKWDFDARIRSECNNLELRGSRECPEPFLDVFWCIRKMFIRMSSWTFPWHVFLNLKIFPHSFSRSKLPHKAMLHEMKKAWPKKIRKIRGGQTNLQISRIRKIKFRKLCLGLKLDASHPVPGTPENGHGLFMWALFIFPRFPGNAFFISGSMAFCGSSDLGNERGQVTRKAFPVYAIRL